MRLTSFALIVSTLFTSALMAESVTASFAVGNVQCGRCAKAVSESLKGTKGVSDASGLSKKSPVVKVTFDPAVVSFQQVALAVAAANPVHGTQYDAAINGTFPDYAKNA
ncbi:MAG: heavy-metal-associated domain-containing protein, partial [Spirochaetia bacterium]|nr:heavy-metal-associated domain-containing protein [Spirochaetia bacterium]